MEIASLKDQREPVAKASAQATPSADATSEPQPEPIQDHNLLRATEQLQSSALNGTSFAPAPILRLNSIRIIGSTGLRPSFLSTLCRPYLDSTISTQNPQGNLALNTFLYGSRITHPLPFQPTTLPSILNLASSLVQDLNNLDVLHSIDASLAPGAGEEDVDIILSCRPKGKIFFKSSTDVGNAEGSASVQGRIRNLFGGAETLQGSATFGTRTKQAFNLNFATPILANPEHQFTVSGFKADRDYTAFSSVRESIKGLKVALSTGGDGGVQNEVAFEAALRSLRGLLPDTSISMRKLAARPSVKAALTHTFLQETKKSYFKLVSSYAGLGGDTLHLKVEMEASRPFFTFRSGLLRTLDGRPSYFSDRFQLGGPTCVRMFRLNGLGPKDKYDSLGGDAFWSAGIGATIPWPKKEEWPLKFHAFLNAGQTCQMDMSKPLSVQSVAPLLEPSVSAGVGLVYLQGPLRVELNAGVPLVARKSDSMRKGLQLGIGISFL